MGTASRPKPQRLAEKLLRIRLVLGVSQQEMIRRLGFEDKIFQGTLSAYERGVREPALPILLSYARVAGVCLDVLVDDELEMPAKLPGSPHHKSPIQTARKRR